MKDSRPSVGVGVFVWKDGKFLMGKRAGKHGRGTWSIPGGYLEHGESFKDASKREILEETGVKIKNVKFMTATNNIFKDEQKHTITIFMSADLDAGSPKTIEHDKFVEVGWFSFDNLPSPLFLAIEELKKAKPDLFAKKSQPPSINRIAELQQMIADFSTVLRMPNIADKKRLENDVEHSFGLALTCWFLAPKIAPHLNIEKVLKYALAHDIVELHAGDTFIMDFEKVKTKSKREDQAILQLQKDWPDFKEMPQAAKDYKNQSDAEAKFVYVIDKLLPPIMVNLGEKDEFWYRHKITKEEHEAVKKTKIKGSPEADMYLKELNKWMSNPDYYYKPEASDNR